ncbi:UNVERIFIED_CONTAM: hypothetical protein PYX00_006195 [Menopon gallinae]|uniref:Signal peptidase complex subunit 2 n=1 Tax=Menopon gallinae TaxID=328185 RepID=A0AAW2HW34_9NEOP
MASKTAKDGRSSKSITINRWDGSACKNALDDAVKEVLTRKYNYTESFGLVDARLLMCGIAVGVAMFALLWDYLYPFPQSTPVLIICVSTYFIMMGILTLYSSYLEKGIFIVAIQKDNKNSGHEVVWEASSYMIKYDDKYWLSLTYKDGKTGTVREAVSCKSVAHYIDENGTIVYEMVEPEVSKLHNSLLSEKKEK